MWLQTLGFVVKQRSNKSQYLSSRLVSWYHNSSNFGSHFPSFSLREKSRRSASVSVSLRPFAIKLHIATVSNDRWNLEWAFIHANMKQKQPLAKGEKFKLNVIRHHNTIMSVVRSYSSQCKLIALHISSSSYMRELQH